MSDTVLIKDLLIRGIIGIHDWEREKKQDILINVQMEADLQPAGQSDDFNDAVDYRAVAKAIISLVETSEFFLVEKMAEEIAAICLQNPKVDVARVRVEKPGAVRFSRSVGVEVERRRG
ncbi:MAG: dihydroneopterin aldolase [Gemmatimonadetes bacterium]|nr:dihydroneopterin aldolase [Gemmatimonadota bacterium]NNM05609.1 dihydroneopterin aldolase [Gemmatimonadota bacterium]